MEIKEWISRFDLDCFAFFGDRQSDFLTVAAKLFPGRTLCS